MTRNKHQESEKIGFFAASTLAVGFVVGPGIFGLSGLALSLSNAPTSLLSWILVAIGITPFLFVFHQLSKKQNGDGGLGQQVASAFGKRAAHAVRLLTLGSYVVVIPTTAFVGAEYLGKLFHLSGVAIPGLTIMIIVFGTGLNLLGTKWLLAINKLAVSSVTFLLLLLISFHHEYLLSGFQFLIEGTSVFSSISFSATWEVCALLVFAFIGWENFGMNRNQVRNSAKTVPKVYFSSWLFISTLYLCVALVVVGASQNAVSVTGITGLYELILSLPMGEFLIWGTILTIVSNIGSWIHGAGRALYLSSKEGALPSVFSETCNGTVPHTSLGFLFILYVTVIGFKMTGRMQLDLLLQLVSQNLLFIYLISVLTFLKLESKSLHRFIASLALIPSALMLSGFSWHLVFPLSLVLIGLCPRISLKRMGERFERPYDEIRNLIAAQG